MANKEKTIHFEISERKILLRIMDVFIILFFLYLTALIWNIDYFENILFKPLSLVTFIFYILFFGTLFDMYNLQIASHQQQIIKSLIICSFTITIFYVITPIVTPVLPSKRYHIFLFLAVISFALFFWRLFYLKYFTSVRFEKNVIFVGNQVRAAKLAAELQGVDPHYKVRAIVNSNQYETEKDHDFTELKIEEILNFISHNHISEIVIADKNKLSIDSSFVSILLKALEKGIVVREFREVYENTTYRLPIFDTDKKIYNYFPFGRSNTNKLYLLGIRTFDIIFSIIGILALLCILPFIYIINLFANKGPIFYKQQRVGQFGKEFYVYKLRSMVVDAEKNGAQFAQKNDCRITPFGKFIRKSRLDEVPQFFNVLKGEMSIIGPRPERPVFVDQIAEVMPLYRTRHVVKPGLTGWAQVKYSYGATIDDSLVKLQYDLFYIKNRNLALDINILIKTLNTVILFKGQ